MGHYREELYDTGIHADPSQLYPPAPRSLADLSPDMVNGHLAYKGFYVKRLSYGIKGEAQPEYIDLLIQGPPNPKNKLDKSGLASLRAYSLEEYFRNIDALGTTL